MEVYLASDHAGFDAKKELITFLLEKGYDVKDFGAFEYDPQDDYPDFIAPLAKAISHKKKDVFGFIFGGSGQGEAIVANRFANVRATVLACENKQLVTLAREHNNANVLSFGARFLSVEFIKQAAILFLETDFSHAPRHIRRIEKIDNLDL